MEQVELIYREGRTVVPIISSEIMKLSVDKLFSSGVVLQRDKPIKIWGNAQSGNIVSVEIQGTKERTVANDNNDWVIILSPLKTSFAEKIVIKSDSELIEVDNVSIGEVWVAGGQSNMEFHMRYDKDFNEKKSNYDNPNIRFFDVPKYPTKKAKEIGDYSFYGFWRPCDNDNIECFSAVAYYFAEKLYEELQVPIGIIGCNYGGTRACCWMDEASTFRHGRAWIDDYIEAVKQIHDLDGMDHQFHEEIMLTKTNPFENKVMDKLLYGYTIEEVLEILKSINPAQLGTVIGPWHECRPFGLFYTMLKTITDFTVKGVIWYQGESDENHPEIYADMLEALIACWRYEWNENFPFIMAQLAPFGEVLGKGGDVFPLLREQQLEVTRRLTNVYLVSTGDVGNKIDIHPKEKAPVGHRMALIGLEKIYGLDMLSDAPMPTKIVTVDDKLIITFEHVGEGLTLAGYKINALEFLDKNLKPVEGIAETRVEYDKVTIRFDGAQVQNIAEVKFAKSAYYSVNLYNSSKIPVMPFVLQVHR